MRLLGNILDAFARWFLPPPVFVAQIRGGQLRLRRGTIPRTVVDGMSDVLKRHDIPRADVWGYRKRDVVLLGFSREIPESVRQQLRNIWASR